MKKTFSLVAGARCMLLLVWLLLLPSGEALAAVQGTVTAWGNNGHGQCAVPTNLDGVVAISAGGAHSLALKGDGTVVAWGWNEYGQSTVPTDLTGVAAIAAGFLHNLALKGDGTVVAWGDNFNGVSTVPANLTGVIAIAAGDYHNLALKGDGTVVQWGQAGVPANPTGVVAIAAGHLHRLVLKADGTIIGWGDNATGQIAVPTNLSGVVAIAAGGFHSLALKGDGTVVAWGNNNEGQSAVPASLSGVVAIAARGAHSLALQGDGTVVAWGDNNFGQSTVPTNLSGVVAIAAGDFHSLALLDLAPVGRPAVFVDGVSSASTNVYARGSATICIFTDFVNGILLYTLDGSDPSISARLYDGPFVVKKSATLRAIAYNADFTQSVQSDPVEITILPDISASTPGGGTVEIFPASGAYLSNSMAMVTATPAPGWTFLNWLGDAEGTNPTINVTMTSDKCVHAIFGTTMATNVIGSGSVQVSPQIPLYPHGSVARFTAIPATGNYFVQWGNAASGTNNPLSFVVTNANPTIAALFASLGAGQLALTVMTDGNGQVTRNPLANRYASGANVTLTASPASGQDFTGWSGDASGTSNPLVVTMDQSRVITAHFTKRPSLAIATCSGRADPEAIHLLVTGEAVAAYEIQSSTNLLDWAPLATVTNLWGTVQHTDRTATNGTQRFYRALGL